MNRQLRPANVAAPAAAYTLGVEVPKNSRFVVTSGIVPIRPDGTTPSDIGDQAGVIWRSICDILAEGHMELSDIVSVTTYVVASSTLTDDLRLVMASRDQALGGHLAASTLVTVPALARPEWKMEISVIAARS